MTITEPDTMLIYRYTVTGTVIGSKPGDVLNLLDRMVGLLDGIEIEVERDATEAEVAAEMQRKADAAEAMRKYMAERQAQAAALADEEE